MNDDQLQQFEDASLKAALKRLHPLDDAPAALRQRILESFVLPQPQIKSTSPTLPARSPQPLLARLWYHRNVAFAFAALILLAVGAVALYQQFATTKSPLAQNPQTQPPAPAKLTFVSDEIMSNLATTHRRCCNKSTHHAVFQNLEADFTKLGPALGSVDKLQHAVWAADLRKDGWEFKGASVCRVGDLSAAHLLFFKGDERLSLFTVKVPGLENHDGETFDTTTMAQDASRCAFSCFVRDSVLCAIVADAPTHDVPTSKLDDIIVQHKDDVMQPDPTVALALDEDTD